jgi:hypothetical protein
MCPSYTHVAQGANQMVGAALAREKTQAHTTSGV